MWNALYEAIHIIVFLLLPHKDNDSFLKEKISEIKDGMRYAKNTKGRKSKKILWNESPYKYLANEDIHLTF